MTLTLDLPGELERALQAEAARRGLPIAEYAVRVLAGSQSGNDIPEIATGADLVAYWEREGVIGSWPDIIDPAAHARRIRAEAERRGV
jgi:hypothetical protein